MTYKENNRVLFNKRHKKSISVINKLTMYINNIQKEDSCFSNKNIGLSIKNVISSLVIFFYNY